MNKLTPTEVALTHYAQVGHECHSLTGPDAPSTPLSLHTPPEGYIYTGIINISPFNMNIKARSIAPGDDLAQTGIFTSTKTWTIEISVGEIHYGLFDRIGFNAPVGADTGTLIFILGEESNV